MPQQQSVPVRNILPDRPEIFSGRQYPPGSQQPVSPWFFATLFQINVWGVRMLMMLRLWKNTKFSLIRVWNVKICNYKDGSTCCHRPRASKSSSKGNADFWGGSMASCHSCPNTDEQVVTVDHGCLEIQLTNAQPYVCLMSPRPKHFSCMYPIWTQWVLCMFSDTTSCQILDWGRQNVRLSMKLVLKLTSHTIFNLPCC